MRPVVRRLFQSKGRSWCYSSIEFRVLSSLRSVFVTIKKKGEMKKKPDHENVLVSTTNADWDRADTAVATTQVGPASPDVDRQRPGQDRPRVRPDNESRVHACAASPIGTARTRLKTSSFDGARCGAGGFHLPGNRLKTTNAQSKYRTIFVDWTYNETRIISARSSPVPRGSPIETERSARDWTDIRQWFSIFSGRRPEFFTRKPIAPHTVLHLRNKQV